MVTYAAHAMARCLDLTLTTTRTGPFNQVVAVLLEAVTGEDASGHHELVRNALKARRTIYPDGQVEIDIYNTK